MPFTFESIGERIKRVVAEHRGRRVYSRVHVRVELRTQHRARTHLRVKPVSHASSVHELVQVRDKLVDLLLAVSLVVIHVVLAQF